LKIASESGTLRFFGEFAQLSKLANFKRMLAESRRVEWVVYSKPPFGGPQQVLAYLARYTHRIAISNSRLVGMEGDQVTFRWRDYRHRGAVKVMRLNAHEFIRRFLLHTLPDGFHRIRHYGFLANGHRQQKLQLCRRLLCVRRPEAVGEESAPQPTATPFTRRCSCCGEPMIILAVWAHRRPGRPSWNDSS